MLDADEITEILENRFPGADIIVKDLVGDKRHWFASITSQEFSGKSKLDQHRLVYDALEGRVGYDLHALKIRTNSE